MDAALRKRVSLRNPIHFLALGFGSGLIPLMPGTFGSLAAIPLLLLFIPLSPWALVVAAVLASWIGNYLCDVTANDMKVHDHGSIVWDEIAGMFITFCFVPLTATNLVVGFVLFRLFDILKPWPIRYVDKHVHGGVGIMLDDIIAGIMSCAVMHLLLFSIL